MPSKFDLEAASILKFVLDNSESIILRDWLSAKLELIHFQGKGEGIEELSKALTRNPPVQGIQK